MQRPLVITAIQDRKVSRGLQSLLEAECWVRVLSTSEQASLTEIVRRAEPAVLVVDVEIADRWLDLDRVAASDSFSLVVVSPMDGEMAVEWLERGADAFLKEPVSVQEIAAQTLSLARKRHRSEPIFEREYVLPGLRINLEERNVLRGNTRTRLSSTEFKLLRTLVENAGRTVPHEVLLASVWGGEYEGDLPLLRSFILRLRKKLGDTGRSQTYIKTRGQLGYSMPRPEGAAPSGADRTRLERVLREAENLRLLSKKVKEASASTREASARSRERRAADRRLENHEGPERDAPLGRRESAEAEKGRKLQDLRA